LRHLAISNSALNGFRINQSISQEIDEVKTMKLWFFSFKSSGSFCSYSFPRNMAAQSKFLLHKRERKNPVF